MNTDTHQQWLADTRRFWNTETEFEAKYRRICSDHEIEACTDEERLRQLWNKRTEEELLQLLHGVPLQPNWVCLEIGCGIGRLMQPVAAMCNRVIGVDISPKMVGYAQDYLRDVPNAEVHVNDGLTLSMAEDGSVDWVYSHLAFQHLTLLEVVEGYLSEIARVLRVGGYCRIQCWREAHMPVRERVKNVGRQLLGRELYHGPRQCPWRSGRPVRFGGMTFHPAQWRGLLETHGLSVIDTELGAGHEYWMWTTSVKK